MEVLHGVKTDALQIYNPHTITIADILKFWYSLLGDINLLSTLNRKYFPIPQILNHILVQPRFPTIFLQSLPSIDAPVWQKYEISLYVTLGMVCVWNIACQVIELRTAYWTDGSCDRRR
jgi:hypothetical protein